ncbi:hypothetical protein HQ325_17010 [Rhodococcus sp. BP-349]|uniref:hypothetical protein n=1 Tax=unclassified Rhodococcus (in: high G+C Gram-positive bacteria) TaxID=192944 RepID=UPI001C9BB39D|nr:MULTISPECIES: hypothetical protein [unclassified Rhodococcus (in: high G+C Gram-positive bacteria)]MBY6540377.1 hypothetical protein [Rhodococcus sp. BP-363]MBY6545598.1 hypothetical protein [Rhodococcus sp. BP-369]MBY6564828.1 hypothetical protein [Rhodococcus sp. BP-370]MBY6578236.1 hypothetical protein [Rhodococcus sp. BP-364]MBY6587537.1 hypothetical protein [Rhodococcus sp. BP-358]
MPLTLPILSRLSATAGAALVAVWALANARPVDLYQAETDTTSQYAFGNNWSDKFLNSSWSAAVALVVAVVAVWLGRKHQLVTTVGALAGLVVLTAPSVFDVPTGLAPTTTGLGAGLLLGLAVSAASSDRAAALALIAGAACAHPIRREVDSFLGSPRDWSITLGGGYSTTLVPKVVLAVVGAFIVASMVTPSARRAVVGHRSRMIAVLILAVATWVVYVSFGDTASSSIQWVLAAAVTVCAAAVVAVRSERDGGFICAGLAVAATTVNGMTWSGWWPAPLALVAVAVGFVLARRVPSTVVGCCVLAAVCVSGSVWDNVASTVAYAAVLPAAAVYSYASSPASDPSVLALGVVLPVMCAVFGFSAIGRRPSGVLEWVPSDRPIEIPAPGSVIPASAAAIAIAATTCVVAAVLSVRAARPHE